MVSHRDKTALSIGKPNFFSSALVLGVYLSCRVNSKFLSQAKIKKLTSIVSFLFYYFLCSISYSHSSIYFSINSLAFVSKISILSASASSSFVRSSFTLNGRVYPAFFSFLIKLGSLRIHSPGRR